MNNSPASRFQDPLVRQAFMYGCDRQGFVDSFLKGKGAKFDTYFFPEWVPKDGITDYSFDIQKAKSLLDQAGFDYSKPVQWLSWNKDARDRQSFLEDCQSKMAEIGVAIEIVNGLDVTNAKTAAGDWDLALYGGYPIADPDQIRQFTGCSAIGTDTSTSKDNGYKWGGANYSNYCNEEFDTLMAQASTITDEGQRAELYKQAQDIWMQDVPIMINFRNATAYAWSSKLQGVTPYGDPSQMGLKITNWSKTP
jgi:ABC-type transport system substrate-binding protein